MNVIVYDIRMKENIAEYYKKKVWEDEKMFVTEKFIENVIKKKLFRLSKIVTLNFNNENFVIREKEKGIFNLIINVIYTNESIIEIKHNDFSINKGEIIRITDVVRNTAIHTKLINGKPVKLWIDNEVPWA